MCLVMYYDTNGIPQPVDVTDGAVHVLIGPTDTIQGLPVTIDFEHRQIHEGESFKAIDQQLSIGTNTVKYAIDVAAYSPSIRSPHMIVGCDVYNGACRVDIYAEATYTGGGAVAAYNRNRNSGTVPSSTIKTGIASTNGTLIDSFFVGTGSKTAAVNRQLSEWVLKSTKVYRIDIIGKAAGTEAIVFFEWYEDMGV